METEKKIMAIPDPTNAIVNITSSAENNAGFGTGFIIYRDQSGDYLLTCKHVVNAVGKETILADGVAAQEIASGSETGFDLAILRVEKSLPRQPLTLRIAQTPCGQFATRGHYCLPSETIIEGGYAKKADIRLSDMILGQIDAASRTELRDAEGRSVPAWWLDLPPNAKHLLQPGYSGAPVIETASGAVVGVVSISLDNGGRGLAISTQAIPLIWPNHPPDLFAAPAAQWPEPIINLDAERAAFDDIVSGKDRQTRLILVHGDSGMGKSHLVSMYEQIADTHHRQTILVDLKEQIGVDGCLSQIVRALGGVKAFPQFHAVKMELTKATHVSDEEKWELLTGHFFAEIEKHSAPQIILLFDAHDRDKPEASFKQWLAKILLPQLAQQDKLVVVVAGQDAVAPPKELKQCHHNFPLKGVSVDKFKQYVEHFQRELPAEQVKAIIEQIQLIHELLHGKPSEFAYFIKSRCDKARQQEASYAR